MVVCTRRSTQTIGKEKRLGFIDDGDNSFASRMLMDITVPVKTTLSPFLTDKNEGINNVIQAMRKLFYNQCLIAGGYATFLLGKTTSFLDVDFFLMIEPQSDYSLFYTKFVHLINQELDPQKEWDFEAIFKSSGDYTLKTSTFQLSKYSFMSLNGELKYPRMHVIKLKAAGINVADFCFYIRNSSLNSDEEAPIQDKILPLDNNDGDDGLQEYVKTIKDNLDVYFVMNVARFNGSTGGLHCWDISGVKDEDKIDRKCEEPVFKTLTIRSEERRAKYKRRISKSFKHYVRCLRRLEL